MSIFVVVIIRILGNNADARKCSYFELALNLVPRVLGTRLACATCGLSGSDRKWDNQLSSEIGRVLVSFIESSFDFKQFQKRRRSELSTMFSSSEILVWRYSFLFCFRTFLYCFKMCDIFPEASYWEDLCVLD